MRAATTLPTRRTKRACATKTASALICVPGAYVHLHARAPLPALRLTLQRRVISCCRRSSGWYAIYGTTICKKDCASGYTNTGLTCYRGPDTYGKGCVGGRLARGGGVGGGQARALLNFGDAWRTPLPACRCCCTIFGCCGGCNSGYTDFG